ncbi:hypothetical protein JTB14_004552 [Gonioctena quinquepunctata]|nr:hypothetical protein JTB14_004552 [Gonioctena quinquepunctata]
MPNFLQGSLKGRSFLVRLGSIESPIGVLENGIPQGSVLSVSLFAIAINFFLERRDNHVKEILYVDDSILLYRHKSMDVINGHLNNEIDFLE